MTNRERTVKEVVTALRERDSGALAELRELGAAVSEIVGNAQWLAAALLEIAEDAKQLAQAGTAIPAARFASLGNYARHVSKVAESHAAASRQLELGIEAWALADEAP